MESGGPASPVFVDPSGRRHRRVVRGAWLLAGLGAAYIGLVVVSLLLPPSVSRLSVPGLGPVLPGPAAAPLAAAEGEDDGPEVLLARSPSPRPGGSRSPRPTPSAAGAPAPTGLPSLTPSVPPTTRPSPAPRPTRASTAAPTAPPGQSDPPGQASRSPRPRPTPSRGPR